MAACPPTAEPQTIAERSRNSWGQLDARIAQGFARRHHGKLREAVDVGVFSAFEMLQRIVAADLARHS